MEWELADGLPCIAGGGVVGDVRSPFVYPLFIQDMVISCVHTFITSAQLFKTCQIFCLNNSVARNLS